MSERNRIYNFVVVEKAPSERRLQDLLNSRISSISVPFEITSTSISMSIDAEGNEVYVGMIAYKRGPI